MEELDNNEPKEKTPLGEEEVSLEELETKYIANPKVGEETEWLKLKKITKTRDTKKQDKEGNSFSIALEKVDYGIILKTEEGDYTLTSWEAYNKIARACKNHGVIEGTEFKVMHIADGFTDKQAVKEKRCYKVLSKDKEGKEYEVTL